MKLHLACGSQYQPGWVNCDIRSDVDVDVAADLFEILPFPDGSAEEILASDFLEHVPPSRMDLVLSEWRRVCAPGATLVVRVPNLKLIAEAIATSSDDQWHALLIRNIYGGHRYGPDGAWDTHHCGWTPSLLAGLLGQYGFVVVENDGALNMTVRARYRP